MACEEALRNTLVLHQIFKNFPTVFLLESVSLVNKTWNTAARGFLRDYRNCRARKPNSGMSDCHFIFKLGRLCRRIKKEGRVVPWNSLRLSMGPSCVHRGASAEKIIEFGDQPRLKDLEIFWNGLRIDADCIVYQPVAALLRQNMNNLLRLNFTNSPRRLSNVLSPDWFSGFPKLEEFSISIVHHSVWSPSPELEHIELVKNMLQNCPKLKRIAVNDMAVLKVIPPEKFGLLHTLKLSFRGVHDEDLLRNVVKARPKLRELGIFLPDVIAKSNRAVHSFKRSLELLLQGCHQSLKNFSISSRIPIADLSFPSLLSLRKLTLGNDSGLIGPTCKDLISFDYERNMPKLEEIEINTETHFLHNDISWPRTTSEYISLRSSSESVQKLTIDLKARNIHFYLLNCLFPNLRCLEIKMKHFAFGRGVMPLPDICQFWPDLQELKIHGAKNFVAQIHDADFLGISEEEAETLRQHEEDEEYLQAVHIVPVRNCILTMKGLRKLSIDFGLILDEGEPRFALPFISKVTEVIAFKRMPHTEISILGTFSQAIR